jgi:hypothetical protein
MIYADNQARKVSEGNNPVSSRKKQGNAPLSAEITKEIWALFEKGYKSTHIAPNYKHLGGLGRIRWSVISSFLK